MWTVGVNKGHLTLGIVVVKAPVWFAYFKVFLKFLNTRQFKAHSLPPACLSIPYFLMKSCELPIDCTVSAALLCYLPSYGSVVLCCILRALRGASQVCSVINLWHKPQHQESREKWTSSSYSASIILLKCYQCVCR